MDTNTLIMILSGTYTVGIIGYIILDNLKGKEVKQLDISDKVIKYKKIQNKINEQCKRNERKL